MEQTTNTIGLQDIADLLEGKEVCIKKPFMIPIKIKLDPVELKCTVQGDGAGGVKFESLMRVIKCKM